MTQQDELAKRVDQLTVVLAMILPVLQKTVYVDGQYVIAAPPQNLVDVVQKILTSPLKEKNDG